MNLLALLSIIFTFLRLPHTHTIISQVPYQPLADNVVIVIIIRNETKRRKIVLIKKTVLIIKKFKEKIKVSHVYS